MSSTASGRASWVVSYVEDRSLVRQLPSASLERVVTLPLAVARAVIAGMPPDCARVAVTAPIQGVETTSETTLPPSWS